METMKKIEKFIKNIYPNKDFIVLHEPIFIGNEKKYLNECIDSTFVSSVGKYVTQFEGMIAQFTGAKYAIAVVNGTQALFIALKLFGIENNNEVITQALTFVATANAIKYTGAEPIFLDVDKDTMGLSPDAVQNFIDLNCKFKDGILTNLKTGKVIKAVVPMHTFGLPLRIKEIKNICEKYNLVLIEDSAESLGSYYNNKHTGTYGDVGIFSFNGNKTITTGGGGMIITDNEKIAQKAKYLTTTAKRPHAWEFYHDELGYNYRLPNINAALGVAQMENLERFLINKRELALKYKTFFDSIGVNFITEKRNAKSNYWLNAILLENIKIRDKYLEYFNNNGIMMRPIWNLMVNLPMYKHCEQDLLKNSKYLADRIINIPSGVRL